MKRNRIITVLLTASMLLLLTACGNGDGQDSGGRKDTEADKGLEVIGETVQYNPNHLVNDGEPVEIEWWLWDGEEIFQKFADQYEEIHPNVSIKIVVNPYDDYWTKLPLALKEGNGPAIFNIHNSYHNNIIEYCEAYDIPTEDIYTDFTGAQAHELDGQIYYIDFGIMTPSIYYNKDLWEEAGLTEGDIPETWEELAQVAQKLTKTDESGNMIQSGFNLNGCINGMLLGMHYQWGENLMQDDGETPNVNSESMLEAAEIVFNFYDEYKVCSKDFGTDGGQSFGQGQSAMVYNWGFYNGTLMNDYPDINYGVFQVPTLDGETPYAYDRYNGESTLGINKANSEEKMEVAQDFNTFFLANIDLQKELCLNYSVFPTHKNLADDAEILENPALNAIADTLDRYIWPGPMPATFENTLKTTVEDVLYNGIGTKEALDNAQTTIMEDLRQTPFESAESLYQYATEIAD